MKCAPTRQRSSFRKAFTLLEMVMVMAIIAVLVGGTIGLMGNVGNNAKIQKADSEFQTLTSALFQYQSLAGRYPTAQQGLQALVTRPTTAPKPKRWGQVLKKLPLDPWNNPYIYKMPGTQDPSTFEIISYGKDGKAGGGDDQSSQDSTQ